jgi:hypothetical protein
MITIALENSPTATPTDPFTASLRTVRSREVILNLNPQSAPQCDRCVPPLMCGPKTRYWPKLRSQRQQSGTISFVYLSDGLEIASIFKQSSLPYVCSRYVSL